MCSAGRRSPRSGILLPLVSVRLRIRSSARGPEIGRGCSRYTPGRAGNRPETPGRKGGRVNRISGLRPGPQIWCRGPSRGLQPTRAPAGAKGPVRRTLCPTRTGQGAGGQPSSSTGSPIVAFIGASGDGAMIRRSPRSTAGFIRTPVRTPATCVFPGSLRRNPDNALVTKSSF